MNIGERDDPMRAPRIAHVIERQVPRNPENPRAAAVVSRVRHGRARDAEEHFLRQIARGLSLSEEPAQVPEHPGLMVGDEQLEIRHNVRHW